MKRAIRRPDAVHPSSPWLLWAIVGLGALLRFYHIGAKGLWIDESFSIWMARQPPSAMLGWLARIDQHPPLYYTLLHTWIKLGDDPATVRALSALCATLTLLVLALLGRRLIGPEAGLLATLILALSPFHVRFAQEARMYALLGLNASLALYALACLLTGRRTWWVWAGYVVFTALTLLTHNTAVFLPLVANLIVATLAWSQRRRPESEKTSLPSLRHWALAQLGVILLWAPWAPALIRQSVGVYREFWIPPATLERVLGVFGAFLCRFLPLSGPLAGIVWLGLIGLTVLGALSLHRRPIALTLLLLTCLIPIAGQWLISIWRPILYTRTLIWASLPLYLLLAAAIVRLRRRFLAILALALIVACNAGGVYSYYVDFQKEAWDEAAALVAERVRPDDLLLFNATWVQIPFDYYFQRLYNGPPVDARGVPVDLFDRGVLEPKMTPQDLPRLHRLVASRERVWLIYSHNWYTDPQGLIPAALEDSLDLSRRWQPTGVQVQLYTRPVVPLFGEQTNNEPN